MKTSLYRFYGIEDQLLYVGVSGRIMTRITHHGSERDMSQVRYIELEWFDKPEDAYKAEVVSIRREKPLWNNPQQKHRKCRNTPPGLISEEMATWCGRGPKPIYPQPTPEQMERMVAWFRSKLKPDEVVDKVSRMLDAPVKFHWVRDQVKKHTGSAARKIK